MNNLKINLDAFKDRLAKIKDMPAYVSHDFQARAIEMADMLGVRDRRDYPRFIKAIKENASAAQRAYSFAYDYPKAKSKISIFFWRFNQIKRGVDNSTGNVK